MTSEILSSKSIKAISKSDVHRICSGQVVLNLATAVKELVENSLDAGATVIEVVLKEYGSESVQVSDNGSGVLPDNFQALTLKHHTSKLQDFSDLLSVETFGFRGEALSSLCALSDMTIVTRHSSLPCATKLSFDSNGIITSTTKIARQVGTTVMLNNIFSSLPVRQREFHRNLKREFSKMCQILTAYCLVSTCVKLTCINEPKRGGRATVVATQGCKSVRENIACIFTTKQLSNLMEISEVELKEETLQELKISAVNSLLFKLEGYISSCAHGSGRATTDRQFFYVNSRPCEPSKIMRTVNEVYHQFNIHQSPFVFLNVLVARNCVDVNVTPDKRQIFLDNEKLLLAVVKESLMKLYENIPSTFQMNNMSPSIVKRLAGNVGIKTNEATSSLRNSTEEGAMKFEDSKRSEETGSESKRIAVNSQRSTGSVSGGEEQAMAVDYDYTTENEVSDSCLQQETRDSLAIDADTDILTLGVHDSGSKLKRSSEDSGSARKNTKQIKLDARFLSPRSMAENKKSAINIKLFELFKDKLTASKRNSQDNKDENGVEIEEECDDSRKGPRLLTKDDDKDSGVTDVDTDPPSQDTPLSDEREDNVSTDVEDINRDKVNVKTASLNVDINSVEALYCRWLKEQREEAEAASATAVRFRAIIDPTKNDQAENELTREISKDAFAKMEVIGQFNLGFIIAKLNSDLFIVDQHATDEKYNFETLEKTTAMTNQKLVIPQKLELTAVNESILIENLEIFRANGFEFQINEDAPPTGRISMTAIPMSKSWMFGKEDIDELLFMLQDSPHTLCRPSRVRAMFASRACRKSVMIGTALNRNKMKSLLFNMGEIEQPWNCPHGRPTMRHLVNLDFYR